MTVRWKPLILLTGLFVVFAVAGLLAFVFVSSSGNAEELLTRARTARAERRFDNAKIYYLQALQQNPRSAEYHSELAEFYTEWLANAPAEKVSELEGQRLRALLDASRHDKTALSPRRALLQEALQGDDLSEQKHWASQIITLDAEDLDARFVLATAALAEAPPNVTEARRHLERLETQAAQQARTPWVQARIATATSDDATLEALLEPIRQGRQPQAVDPIDRMCLLRLRALDATRAGASDQRAERARAFVEIATTLIEHEATPPSNIVEISQSAQRIREALELHRNLEESSRTELTAALEQVTESGFQEALARGATNRLWIYVAFADHLAVHSDRARCLDVVQTALALPDAAEPVYAAEVLRLHEIAVKTVLADADDEQRFAKAKPHIQGLIDGPNPMYQGIGHLFQGAIDLERSGLTVATDPDGSDADQGPNARLEAARKHLKMASERLPKVATARALYGIVLLLSGEPGIGRQYLQEARRLGPLEARYQIWAAWSMLQAGYPEEAEPIVTGLLKYVADGDLPTELESTLRVLRGEIAQARQTPKDLQLARTEYEQAIVAGEPVPPAIALRLAQLAIVLDGPEQGLEQLDVLRANGSIGPAAEHLAVVTLNGMGKLDAARETLDDARRKYPDSSELAKLDAALWLDTEQPEQADRVLDEFLTKHPDNIGVIQIRARLLADRLDRIDDARMLLSNAADETGNSGPLVQLALIDLSRREYGQTAQSIARIRNQWPEAATADLLDAQLSLARQDLATAASHLDAALTKDPSNKVALFWKAQIDDRSGSAAEAALTYEKLARDGSVKELPNGLTLSNAAQWALGSLALQNKDLDGAIERFQGMLEHAEGDRLARPIRWKLVNAFVAKGEWETARREMLDLLNDPQTSSDERVQAAEYFRRQNELDAANAQLDLALKSEPDHSGAVVVRAFLLSEAERNDEATQLLRQAIAANTQPPAVYLMLAGIKNNQNADDEDFRTVLTVIDDGLEQHPDALELVRAKYSLLNTHGDPDEAIAVIETKAEEDSSGRFQRLLADVYREQELFDKAEAIVNELLEQEPRNARLAAVLVGLVASQAVQASQREDTQAVEQLNLRTSTLIHQFREQFSSDLRFPQAECELAMRQGDFVKAEAITRQIDQLDSNSIVGPMLRARIYTDQGWTERAAQAYNEVLSRDPNRVDVRLTLGQTYLQLERADDALFQATKVLERTPTSAPAILLRARALIARGGSQERRNADREEAINILVEAIRERPRFPEAYREVASIQRLLGRRSHAIATLTAARKSDPNDAAALALLVQYLAEPRSDGRPADPSEIEKARKLAETSGNADTQGETCLALAVGFHKAGQYELARPWAEKASSLLDAPAVHLNHGDLLLSMAEAESDPDQARAHFEAAIEQYDKVLALQPNSVEAVNNKAWILHRHLGRDSDALELAEALPRRVERKDLPSEFFDTLGAIQLAMGRQREAEQSFEEGLRKAPNHPVLNFHMGRLIASDQNRAARAEPYLLKARTAQEQLPAEMLAEVERLLQQVGRSPY